jgi:hypothetical protein
MMKYARSLLHFLTSLKQKKNETVLEVGFIFYELENENKLCSV